MDDKGKILATSNELRKAVQEYAPYRYHILPLVRNPYL